MQQLRGQVRLMHMSNSGELPMGGPPSTRMAIGNLTAKSDAGAYTYPAAGRPRPHAVTSISGGTINTT